MNTKRKDLIICPYCEYENSNSLEHTKHEGEIECESCSQPFSLLVEIEHYYTTKAIRKCYCNYSECENCKPDGRCCCHHGECRSMHEEFESKADETICMCFFCGAEMHLLNGEWIRHDHPDLG